MGIIMNEIFEQIAKSRITLEEFGDFIEHFPALLWRIDIINNRIEYLNRHQIIGLGEQSGLLLQNHTFRRKIVLEEDFHFLEQFMAAVRNGETKATVFRIRINEGEVIWIKLTGTLYRKNPPLLYRIHAGRLRHRGHRPGNIGEGFRICRRH
jgi:PAS domain-containing protein